MNHRRPVSTTVAATAAAGLVTAVAMLGFVSHLAAVPAPNPSAAITQPDNAEQFTPLQTGMLYLRAGDIRTSELPDIRDLPLRQFEPDNRYIVQFDRALTAEKRAELEQAGIVLHDYLPHFAYIANLSNAQPAALNGVQSLIWVGEYQPAWKIDAEVGQREYVTPERQQMAAEGLAGVIITLFHGAERAPVLKALADIDGADVHWTDQLAGNPIISATIPLDNVAELAWLNEVQFVEDAWEITPRNNNARWVVQSNINGVTPLYDAGLRGEDQIAGVLDNKLDHNHCSFHDPQNPIGPDHRKIVAYNTTFGSQFHGTHVSGTIAGDAGQWNNTRGVAWLARIAYNTWPSFNEQAIYNRFTLHHGQGARMHTNSWGNDGTTQYDGLARGIDAFQWDFEESQTFWAVTNTATLKNPENAKNLLAVGATSPPPNQHNHCTGGAGPTSDGRRKPEIYAPGCSTVSASPGSCSTGSASGTSMACPAVAGVGVLARQYYMEGFYPTGAPNPSDAFTPSAALVKATLLNSAVDMTGVPGYPSNLEGWGRVLADKSLHFVGDDRTMYVADVWNADGLTTGQEHEHYVYINSSSEKVKITLVWTDYPGAAGTNFAAVNNLDLQVIAPDGTYWGNVFSGGQSATGGSPDDRNNVEQVHRYNPAEGLWTIRVIGTAVNQNKQGYALVVTGDVHVEEPPLTISLPNGAPGLIDPGVETSFDVLINPGQENVVPGSEMLFYRTDGGAWNSVNLAHLGGELYQATLPAMSCDDEPEFYLQAEGDGGTIVTSPSNAPNNVYSADVGEIEVVQILYENFNSGLPSGWSATGLWHTTSSCPVSGACDGPLWAYYGVSTNNQCTFNTGGANSGQMTSAAIQVPEVPQGGSVTLSFCYNLITEDHPNYDIATFGIVGGPSQRMNESPNWTTFTMDITQFAGEQIQLYWHFDTIDGWFNDYRGWQVDAVEITAAGLACEEPDDCPWDFTGDGVVDGADLGQLLANWGACSDCDDCPWDVTGDCVVDGADLGQLLANWGDCP